REWLEGDDSFFLTHGGTYSGHPSCCAAGLANLEILERERLPERAGPAGRRLRARPAELRSHHIVADVRREGLMHAVAFEPRVTANDVSEALIDRGVIGRPAPYANSVAFSPPLIVSDDEIDEIVEATDAAIGAVAATV